jgi:uncharacterized protein (TIGR00369 family)
MPGQSSPLPIPLPDTAVLATSPKTPPGSTTIELKSNFTGTLVEGVMVAEAKMVHSGKTTQVWDVEVRDESTGKMMALFRATQMILYPRI